MKIRKATEEDYEDLRKLKILSKKEELKYSKSLKSLKETQKKYDEWLKIDLSRDGRAIFLAEVDDKIVGMVLGKGYDTIDISKFKRKGYISNLYVDERYRNKGVAKKLISETIKWLKSQEVPHVSVEVHVDNEVAQEFFKGSGFEEYTVKLIKDI